MIASGGSTKKFKSAGLNPFFLSDKEMVTEIENQPNLVAEADKIKEIYFFGAGCSSPDKREMLSNVLSLLFPHAYVSVDSDLLGSAYATCGSEPGLCCILGTGSNIAYFNGENIFGGKHGLGYILGDEGSGSYFGKKLVTDYLYGRMPEEINCLFKKKYKVNKSKVVGHVYHKPGPNYYLASFAAFFDEIKNTAYGKNLICEGLTEFVVTNIKGYPDYQKLKCHFVGSIAWHLQEKLLEICETHQIQVGKILKHPINDLVNFFLNRE